ncbi:MAG: DUF1156 domain-containing protein [Xanthomonadales bacterium]|nr:DUF1156 domain-containing protein [Xanthomonadales bacterium]
MIFAQMVDDPSSVPEEFPTPEAQQKERERLFRSSQSAGAVGKHHERGGAQPGTGGDPEELAARLP